VAIFVKRLELLKKSPSGASHIEADNILLEALRFLGVELGEKIADKFLELRERVGFFYEPPGKKSGYFDDFIPR
jgi:hypothetical protein